MNDQFGGNFTAPIHNNLRPPLVGQGQQPGSLQVVNPGSGGMPIHSTTQDALGEYYRNQGYPGGGFPQQQQSPQGGFPQQQAPGQVPFTPQQPPGQVPFQQPQGGFPPQQPQGGFPQQQPQQPGGFPPQQPQGGFPPQQLQQPGGGQIFQQLIQDQQNQSLQGNQTFQNLSQGLGGQIPQDFIQKGMKLGLNVNQIQALYNDDVQKQQNNQLNAQQQKQQESLDNLKRSQETLKLVWGNQFDQNIGSITKYIESQTPNMGDLKTRTEEIKRSVTDILTNPAMAKNMLGLIQQQQQVAGGQGQQNPQIPGSGNQYGQPDATGMNAHQQDKSRWVQLMQPGSPLHSSDPYIKQNAEREYDTLAKKLASAESTGLLTQGMNQGSPTGFLGVG